MRIFPEHITVRIVLKEGLPLRSEHNPDWPWFDVVRTKDGTTYRYANPANLEEMIKWSKDIDGEDTEIIVSYE